MGDVMTDHRERQFAISGEWALGSDGLQWILYQRHRRKGGKDTWDGISFVRSTRDILARCMREKGVPGTVQATLLAGLPETFDEWKRALP
jgi:hypothetical protein